MGTSWKLVLVFGLCLTCVEPAHGQRRGGRGGGRAGTGERVTAADEAATADRWDDLEAG